jgi:hypothetical protein
MLTKMKVFTHVNWYVETLTPVLSSNGEKFVHPVMLYRADLNFLAPSAKLQMPPTILVLVNQILIIPEDISMFPLFVPPEGLDDYTTP